jgi:transcriptional antiterminator NusG
MKRWYIIHAYSGYEKQVMRSLNDRIQRSTVADSFGEVLVPTEEVVEMKDGKKRKSERKFFPGYVLVEMEMNDDTWHIVKECPKVLGFIGGTPENQRQLLNVKQMRFLLVYVILVKHLVLRRCLNQVKNYS